jgi:hypothetical protein
MASVLLCFHITWWAGLIFFGLFGRRILRRQEARHSRTAADAECNGSPGKKNMGFEGMFEREDLTIA